MTNARDLSHGSKFWRREFECVRADCVRTAAALHSLTPRRAAVPMDKNPPRGMKSWPFCATIQAIDSRQFDDSMTAGMFARGRKPSVRLLDIVRAREANGAGGIAKMDFVGNVEDYRTPEITVTGVASIQAISDSQVRIAYFVRRNNENYAIVALIWDRDAWLATWRTVEQAREGILAECANDNRLGVH